MAEGRGASRSPESRGRGRKSCTTGGRGDQGQGGRGRRDSAEGLRLGNQLVAGALQDSLSSTDDAAGVAELLQSEGSPRRPGFGSKGRKITVLANHFKLVSKLMACHQYNITISRPGTGGPPTSDAAARPLPATLNRSVLVLLAQQEGWAARRGWAFDGHSNLYIPHPWLPQEEQNLTISDLYNFVNGRAGMVEVPQAPIQALDVSLRHSISMRPTVASAAGAFFFEDGPKRSLMSGLEARLGFFQSLRPSQAGLTLNVDIAASAFLEPVPCLTLLQQTAGMKDLNSSPFPAARDRASMAFKGIKIVMQPSPGMTRWNYRCTGLTSESADAAKFLNVQTGQEMSVAQYFSVRYQKRLTHGHLPCLSCGSASKAVAINNTMLRIDARILDPPELKYADKDPVAEAFGASPEIIFVALPVKEKDLYEQVKRASDSFLGIPSQCFVASSAGVGKASRGGRAQYTANLALKVNAKIGGCNARLSDRDQADFMQEPFMVLGADVTHPVGASESEPSIAAVTGSMDRNLATYAAEVQLQPHRLEIIQGLKDTVKKLLLAWQANNVSQGWPRRLFFYRDGVSETQFKTVQALEITQIRMACRAMHGMEELSRCCFVLELGIQPQPRLTFLVVQKRHHTRIFPEKPQDAERSGNVWPGTVVDSDVTHPTEHDFFLVSHSGIQGTSRPTHYHVLWDENANGADVLQAFTYKMCYLFCLVHTEAFLPAEERRERRADESWLSAPNV
ncbi:hypothetical protein WJX84_002347 [Apatococcus fuscideae]|uniref:Uncharacterized protein n=1 Tax=Apatococcus fuscideae TaxID=2026836 RepID=A0AAW1TFX9_9CHLO